MPGPVVHPEAPPPKPVADTAHEPVAPAKPSGSSVKGTLITGGLGLAGTFAVLLMLPGIISNSMQGVAKAFGISPELCPYLSLSSCASCCLGVVGMLLYKFT